MYSNKTSHKIQQKPQCNQRTKRMHHLRKVPSKNLSTQPHTNFEEKLHDYVSNTRPGWSSLRAAQGPFPALDRIEILYIYI